MWFVFAALSGVLHAVEMLLQRFLLHAQKDAWAFSFFCSFVGVVITFPLMLSNPQIPHEPGPWPLAFAIGALIVCHNLLIFKATHFIEASLLGSFNTVSLTFFATFLPVAVLNFVLMPGASSRIRGLFYAIDLSNRWP